MWCSSSRFCGCSPRKLLIILLVLPPIVIVAFNALHQTMYSHLKLETMELVRKKTHENKKNDELTQANPQRVFYNASASSQNDFKENSADKWLSNQNKRRQIVNEFCSKHPEMSNVHLQQLSTRYFLADDKHKVLYCYIPKAACSSWKWLLMAMGGKVNMSNVRHQQLHDGKLLSLSGVKQISKDEIDTKRKLETYTKMIVVREPLDRLVSAWGDKMAHIELPQNAPYFKSFARSILRMYRKDMNEEKLKTGLGVTLDEFLRFVGNDKLLAATRDEPHWMHYDQLCHPCFVKYDYILKVETMDEDSEEMLSRVFKSDVRLPKSNKAAIKGGPDELLNKIPASVLEGIHKRFNQDFQMFGYDWSYHKKS